MTLLIGGVFYLTSCEKEETCKQCSAVQVTKQNGQVIATQNISAVQYCGDALQQIEANPVVTANQTVGTITQEVTATYTCQ